VPECFLPEDLRDVVAAGSREMLGELYDLRERVFFPHSDADADSHGVHNATPHADP